MTAVQGDASDLDDLDRLYDTVKREKGSIDMLWASAGTGEAGVLGEITEEQFHRAFWLNARGTLFTVQKALPLINDNGSIFMTGSNASLGAFPGWTVRRGNQGRIRVPHPPQTDGPPRRDSHRRPVPRFRRLQLRQRPGTGRRRRHHCHLNHPPGM
nr:SDR family oxidoreductase [Kribbella soli]